MKRITVINYSLMVAIFLLTNLGCKNSAETTQIISSSDSELLEISSKSELALIAEEESSEPTVLADPIEEELMTEPIRQKLSYPNMYSFNGGGGGGGGSRIKSTPVSALCGNANIDDGERCDDANAGSCTQDCLFPLYETDLGLAIFDEDDKIDGIIDDNFKETALNFTFPFQGADSYTSAFISVNGFISFNANADDPSEEVIDLLEGLPFIGVLWDDLILLDHEDLKFKDFGDRAVFTWTNVSQFGESDSNSFQMQIDSSGKVLFSYRGITLIDALVGISPGSGALDPMSTNLDTNVPNIPGSLSSGSYPTVYEIFSGYNTDNGDNDNFDLDNQSLYLIPHTDNTGWQVYRYQ